MAQHCASCSADTKYCNSVISTISLPSVLSPLASKSDWPLEMVELAVYCGCSAMPSLLVQVVFSTTHSSYWKKLPSPRWQASLSELGPTTLSRSALIVLIHCRDLPIASQTCSLAFLCRAITSDQVRALCEQDLQAIQEYLARQVQYGAPSS